MKRFVYLAGPVLDCTADEAKDWRKTVALALAEHGIVGISPLRCEPLIGERYAPSYEDHRFGTPRAILAKNRMDVRLCDMMLAYLPAPPANSARLHSWGTMAELAWGHAWDKPTILVTDCPRVRAHPVINASAGWVLGTLDEGVEVLVGLLGAYTGGSSNV